MLKAAAIEVIRATELNGGGTFYAFGGKPVVLEEGFMVGGLCRSVSFPWGEEDTQTVKRLQSFSKAAAPVFKANPLAYLGTWVDDSGVCHLDVSQLVYGKFQAIVTGLQRGERAIWDNSVGEAIDLSYYREALTEIIDYGYQLV